MSPDLRKHRGAHPEDRNLFRPAALPVLRAAVHELSWLLTRGYPTSAALKLVGDRHLLTDRQRLAVSRAACSDESRDARKRSQRPLATARSAELVIDGFNLLITVEAALSGGVLLRCRDGCTRDLASVHGTYRTVEETDPALRIIGAVLASLSPSSVRWLLDSPVSNSGRLAARLRDLAAEQGWPWQVETVFNPDREIVASSRLAVSSDSAILDGVTAWIDVAGSVIEASVPHAWRIDLWDRGEG